MASRTLRYRMPYYRLAPRRGLKNQRIFRSMTGLYLSNWQRALKAPTKLLFVLLPVDVKLCSFRLGSKIVLKSYLFSPRTPFGGLAAEVIFLFSSTARLSFFPCRVSPSALSLSLCVRFSARSSFYVPPYLFISSCSKHSFLGHKKTTSFFLRSFFSFFACCFSSHLSPIFENEGEMK